MKRILLENKEERVALLRKVFGIDKYEKITQNATGYAKSLRERKRAFDAVLVDLEEKKQQAEKSKQEQKETEQQISVIVPQLTTIRTQLAQEKQKLDLVEKQRTQAETFNREFQISKSQLLTKQQQKEQTQTDLAGASQQLLDSKKDLPEIVDLTEKTNILNKELQERETEIRNFTSGIAECNTIKRQASETTQKITSLAQCPTCLQDVSQNHKHQILETEQKKIQEVELKLVEHNEKVKNVEAEIQTVKQELEKIRQQEKETAIAKVKIQHAQELEGRKVALEKRQIMLMQEISSFTDKIAQLEQQLIPLEDIQKKYEELRKQTEQLLSQERTLSIQESTLKQKQTSITQILTLLEKEIARKETAKKELEKTQNIHQWITDYFVPLIDVIEKQVMAKIHHEFDALFQQWFGMLVEDLLTAKLDETFTPIIQQNGYDTEVQNLSGGEKTACALAYRLALNKTINSLISEINTKDLLILDEPTDGFSAEQLDKMREVLAQLHLKQIIIVSHEQKIEGFADSIIRIAKEDHNSQISF